MRCVVKEIGKFSANGRDITSVCLDPTGEDALHVRHIDLQLFVPAEAKDEWGPKVGEEMDVIICSPKTFKDGGSTKVVSQINLAENAAFVDIQADEVISKPTNVAPEKPADAPTPASDATTKQDASPAPEKPADSPTPPAA